MDKVSRTCDGMPKGLTHIPLESQKEKRQWQKKKFEEIMTKKLPQFGKRDKFTDSRSSGTPSPPKKKLCLETYHIQTMNIKDKD